MLPFLPPSPAGKVKMIAKAAALIAASQCLGGACRMIAVIERIRFNERARQKMLYMIAAMMSPAMLSGWMAGKARPK